MPKKATAWTNHLKSYFAEHKEGTFGERVKGASLTFTKNVRERKTTKKGVARKTRKDAGVKKGKRAPKPAQKVSKTKEDFASKAQRLRLKAKAKAKA